ncbi:hypothetical protein Zmor_027816 [Zophobas morio]|uniref:Ionotropic receptor n=1 Tax=Zophobas morio TaxID=2755281 RepID=A0AA38M3D0_9CUCU|nr:hypothetical protein Zmor_027816 [Zophobas morio]
MFAKFVSNCFLISLCASTNDFILPKASPFEVRLLKYLERPCPTEPHHYATINTIDRTDDKCRHLLDSFVKNFRHPSVIEVPTYPTATEYYAFLPNLNTIKDLFVLWNSRSKIHVVVCNPILDPRSVSQTLSTLWEKKILNFVLVVVDDDLQVITYNPFNHTIINLSRHTCSHFFDKLKDIHGYVLKVAMCQNPPLLEKTAGEWRGSDFSLLELVIFALNATLKIVETPLRRDLEGIRDAIVSKKADFSFLGLSQGFDYDDLDFLSPYISDGVVALVPRTHRRGTILRIFDAASWAVLTILTLFLFLCVEVLNRLGLRGWGASKLLSVLSISFAIGVLTIFQSIMTGTLTKVRYHDDVNSVADLGKSDLRVLAFPRYFDMACRFHHLCKRIEIVDKRELYDVVRQGRDDMAFLLPYFVGLKFAKIQKNGRWVYRIMDEFVVPSHRVYLFEKNSPYLEEMGKIMLQLKQLGLMHKIYFENRFDEEVDDGVFLTLMHLSSVFGFLLLGYFGGFVCFLGELGFSHMY